MLKQHLMLVSVLAAVLCLVPPVSAIAGPKTDLAALCLELAPIQEPEVDVERLRQKLDDLTAKCRQALAGADSAKAKIGALNQVLLTGRKVSYLTNKYWRDSTLAAAVLRGRGNCLATTTLYVVLAQRLELPIHAVRVPGHIFARWVAADEQFNIETTAGGKRVSDEDYRAQTNWLENDAQHLHYGRTLTDAQFAAVLHYYAGSHLSQTRKPRAALQMFDKALALWPANPGFVLGRLAELYTGLGRRQEALEGYRKLQKTTKSLEVRVRAVLGQVGDLQGRSRHAQALDVLRKAYKYAPKHMQRVVLELMATSYRALRRFSEALVAQELATVLSNEAEIAGAYVGLAIMYKNAEKLDDAVRCLQASLKHNPESWNTRLILAGYLIRAGRDEEGWKMFETVEKPRVNLVFFHNNMAWFFASVGKKKEFLEHLEKTLDLSQTPRILSYIETEVDFDRYREDEDFKALVAKHRKRLTGE